MYELYYSVLLQFFMITLKEDVCCSSHQMIFDDRSAPLIFNSRSIPLICLSSKESSSRRRHFSDSILLSKINESNICRANLA